MGCNLSEDEIEEESEDELDKEMDEELEEAEKEAERKPRFSLANWTQGIVTYPEESPKRLLGEIFKIVNKYSYDGYRKNWETMVELFGYYLGLPWNPWLYSLGTSMKKIENKLDPRVSHEKELSVARFALCEPKHTEQTEKGDAFLDQLIYYMVISKPLPSLSRGPVFFFAKRMKKVWSYEVTRLPKDKQKKYDEIQKANLFERFIAAARKDPWDYFGEMWTEMELGSRKNALGQFLTPRAIVQFMTKSTIETETGENEKDEKEPKTILDPCTGTGRFLIVPTSEYPNKRLILFGIEIDVVFYRVALVNMAILANHPYSIVRGDTLAITENYTSPASEMWSLGNQWDPPSIAKYYDHRFPDSPFYKRADQFSLAARVKAKQEEETMRRELSKILPPEPTEPEKPKPVIEVQQTKSFSLSAWKKKTK